MTGKEYIEEELKLDDNHLTSYDRTMLEKILKDLERLEKQDKILEIIKKKNVNIGLIKVVSEVKRYNQTYVIDNMLNVKWQLTEEEFNLLKEVLDNGK